MLLFVSFVWTRDSLFALLFYVLQENLAKLRKARQLANRESKRTQRKLARVLNKQRARIWDGGKAVKKSITPDRSIFLITIKPF